MTDNNEVILTREGYERLEQELEHLKTVRRKEVAERIKEALDFGDISENSEYDDAKNEQAFIEGRIITIENILRNARLIDDADVETTEVNLGTTVRLQDMDNDEILEYKIVGSAEVDPLNNKISNESPVGNALLGNKVDDVIEIEVPAGKLRYRILGISKKDAKNQAEAG